MTDMKLIVCNHETDSWKFYLPSDGQKSYRPTDSLIKDTVTTVGRFQKVTSLPEAVTGPKT